MVDIIVPVYNAEKYLERCVNSIISQTETRWNLYLINDGSKDTSPAICDFFAQKYSNISVIHKQNGGVSSARNTGIEASCSEFIMFVDSDDWIRPELLKRLLEKAECADLASGGYQVVGFSEVHIQTIQSRRISIEEIGDLFPQMIETNLANSPVSKVYRRSIIGTQRFDETVALGEDFLFNLEYFLKCKTIEFIECDDYIYDCSNEDSATKKFREQDVEQIVELYRRGMAFATEYCRNEESKKVLEKRLCVNGINMLQMIMGARIPYARKKELALRLLNGDEFSYCYNQQFQLPKVLEIPRRLCTRHSLIGLRCYYAMKNIGRVIVKWKKT